MKTTKNEKVKLGMYDKKTVYEAKDALAIAVKTATAKFDETIELHVKLGVDGTQADQQVRGTVVLPAGTGKNRKVLVIARGDKAEEAKKYGADEVGAEEIIAKIQNQNYLDFDVCITTPDMMPVLGRVARILGPRGLMPNPKSGTVTTDLKKAIADVKAGKVEYRLDKTNNVHTILGKASFGAEKLLENYNAVLTAIIKAKPATSKGTYLRGISICSTMGPAIKVKPQTL